MWKSVAARASSPCTWFFPRRLRVRGSCTEKNCSKHHSALDFTIPAAYQCGEDCENGTEYARILSMSASTELEPGPRSCSGQPALKLANGLSIPMEWLKVQAKATRVGRGGFAGG